MKQNKTRTCRCSHRACNRRKLYQRTGCRKQMRSGTAYGQHSCRRNTWSCMGRWHCILCKFTPQSARSRKLYGFSGKHGRCFMLWSGLQKMPHLKSYLPCRSDRNRIPWRTCRLSGCFVSDGNCAGRTFRLCRSIPYFHCRRKYPCFHPDHSSGKRRRYVSDPRSIIIVHSYSTLL